MGGSNTKDNRRQVKGGIFIQLQKTAFISSETIQGILFINLEEPFEGNILQIQLEGVEETHYTYQIQGNKRKVTRTAYGLNQFVNFSISVYDFSLGQSQTTAFILQPGQWQIPFQLTLGDKLPSSMIFFQSDYVKCQLRYCLKADILSTNANICPVSGAQEILIGQQINFPLDSLQGQIQSEPQICCCCSDGKINLIATTDQMQYIPSEEIKIQLNCDLSKYNHAINFMNVTFQGQLIMRASNTQRTKQMIVYSDNQIVLIKDKNITDSLTIKLPPNIPLTTNGNLIQLSYSIQIQPDIDTCWCVSENVPLVIPLMINPTKQTIQYLPIPQLLQMQAPTNWQPALLQEYQFSVEQIHQIQQQQAMHEIQQQIQRKDQIDLMTGQDGKEAYL